MRTAGEWIITASQEQGLGGERPELVAADQTWTVLFDGVIYERDRLARELDLPADPRRRDAELLLAACRSWQEPTPERLNGVFTIVAWNAVEHVLYAIRDPLGLQPLFRCERGDTVFLTNSLDALARDPRISTTVSPIALAALISRRMPDQEETYYTSVKRVPQGHVWQWSPRRQDLRRYWHPYPAEHVGAEPVGPAEVDAVLERAVSRRLAGDATGIYLSGGIDSVAVAAYAAAVEGQVGRTPLALSLAVPGEDVGDTQRTVATALGLPRVLLPLDEPDTHDSVLGQALGLAADWPAPLLNPWLPGFLRLNDAAVSRGCRSILTGNGGDEWQTSPFLAADLIRTFRLRRLASLAAVQRRSYGHSWAQVTKALAWRYGLRALLVTEMQPLLERRARPLLRRRLERVLPAWLAPDRALRRELLDRPTRPAQPRGGIHLGAARRTYEHPLQDAEVEELFESGRRSNVAFAHPWWDLDLLRLLSHARPDDLDRGGRAKGLVRETVDRRFPKLVLATRSHAVTSDPFTTLLCQERPLLLKRLGRLRALADLGIVNPDPFEVDFARLDAYRDPRAVTRIWNALILEAWVRVVG